MLRHILTKSLIFFVLAGSVTADEWSRMFSELDHDFGQVQRGTKLNHSFRLTNSSRSEMRIRGVRVSCNCTVAHATSLVVPAGGSTSIEAMMDTTSFAGHKTVTITVSIERPRRAEVQLRVSAVSLVNGGLSASSEVDVGIIAEGAAVQKRMNVDHAGETQWTVTGLDFGSPHVKAVIREVSRDEKKIRYELIVDILSTAPAGTFSDLVRIHTNSAKEPTVNLMIKATIQPKLSISPEKITLDPIAATQGATKGLVIKASKPFRVLRIEDGTGQVQGKFSPDAKESQVVQIAIKPNGGQPLEHIDIVTDLDGEKVISVPIVR